MELDFTQLASSLGIGGPIVVAAMFIIKKVAEKMIAAQEEILINCKTQTGLLATLVEKANQATTHAAQTSDRLTRLEGRLDQLFGELLAAAKKGTPNGG